MNNEEQELLDEVYNNYLTYIHDVVQGENQIYGGWYGKEEFINKCKTDNEFSKKWGLKIEERELSWEERVEFLDTTDGPWDNIARIGTEMDRQNLPTKLITITYKEQTIKSYE